MRVYHTEEEQLEALGLWWRAWRLPLVGGLLAALAGILVYNLWQGRSAEQHRQAYEMQEQILNLGLEASQALEQLDAADGTLPTAEEVAATEAELQPVLDEMLTLTEDMFARWPYSGYTWLAVLDTVPLAQQLKRDEAATELLRRAVGATDGFWRGDELFNGIFRLRLARQLSSAGQVEEALELLESQNLEPFNALVEDLRGDLFARDGRMEEARASWTQALTEVEDRFFAALIQSKLSSWSILNADPEPPPTEEASATPAEQPSAAQTAEPETAQ